MKMNESINLPKLISLIASSAECSPAIARRFLHDFFALIESTLQHGESVSIKGVGEFIRTDNPTMPVKFLADKELADIANEPFAAFEAVELNDGVDENILAEADDSTNTPVEISVHAPVEAPQQVEVQQEVQEPEIQPILNTQETTPQEAEAESESEPESKSELITESESSQITEPQIAPEEDNQEQEDEPDYNNEEESSEVSQSTSHSMMWLLVGLLIGLIIGLVGGYFAGKAMSQYTGTDEIIAEADSLRNYVKENYSQQDSIATVDSTKADSVVNTLSGSTPKQEVAIPEPTEVYDRVTTTLTRLSIKHYGNKDYWVFIFKANPQLKDPDRIAPGTKVLIPAISSFECPTKSETDAKALQLLNEIKSKK